MKIVVLSMIAAATITGCQTSNTKTAEMPAPVPVPAVSNLTPVPPAPKPEVDEAAMDRSVSPCNDFYQYACGGWIAKTQAPKDRPLWARGFTEIAERNLAVLRKILENYEGGDYKPKNKYSQKLGDFYHTCMDLNSAEKASEPEVSAQFKAIDKIKTVSDLTPLLAELHIQGVQTFFSVGNEIDNKNPNLMILSVDQGALGLPDRDYYIKDDKNMLEIRQRYLKHISQMFQLTGIKAGEAERQANDVLVLETKLARGEMSRLDRRQPENVYHRIEMKGLTKAAPHFPWAKFLAQMGYPGLTQIDVNDPHYIETFDRVLTEDSLDAMKSYLKYHVITNLSAALSKAIVDENFDFYNKTLFGQEEISPRWKRCINLTEGALGMALGQAFADETFGPEGKKSSREMIGNIERSFGDGLKTLTWMDTKTKREAAKKLAKVFNKIGYPDKARDYGPMKINRESFVKNFIEGTRFMVRYYMNKIGKPVDRKEWSMTPPTVNAYYDAQFNEMVFPAGILQPPFYFRDGGAPINYGAIGVVMGHELTHGYDDQGRKYNDLGQLKNWWTEDSAKEFEKRVQCVSDQYDAYTVQGTYHVNGKLTLGENIADQGGMKLAYHAWTSLNRAVESAPPSDAQKFFLGFAQSWCAKVKPEMERMRLVVDFHSPPRYRVNGTVSSSPAFQEAFQCKTGSPMAPEKRCSVW